jgi:hypothetical protein
VKTGLVLLGLRGTLKQEDLLVRKKTAWGKIFGAPSTSIGAGSSTCTASTSAAAIAAVSELSSYLDSDTVTCFDDDFNILNWWHEHKLTYHILSILARDIMSVPVSIVSSESCFNLTGRVIEERRLLPHSVEMLTCIKDWELGDARAQHEVEKGMQELEDADAANKLLEDGEGQAEAGDTQTQ